MNARANTHILNPKWIAAQLAQLVTMKPTFIHDEQKKTNAFQNGGESKNTRSEIRCDFLHLLSLYIFTSFVHWNSTAKQGRNAKEWENVNWSEFVMIIIGLYTKSIKFIYFPFELNEQESQAKEKERNLFKMYRHMSFFAVNLLALKLILTLIKWRICTKIIRSNLLLFGLNRRTDS